MSLDLAARFARLKQTQQVVLSASAVTVTDQKGPIEVLVNPASLMASLALTAPAKPFDGQRVTIIFGGTVTSGNVVTSFTFVANTGQTVLEPAAPGARGAGTALIYKYNLANTKWYRVQ